MRASPDMNPRRRPQTDARETYMTTTAFCANRRMRRQPYQRLKKNGRDPDETRFGKREVLISLTAAREFLAWLQAEEKRLKAQRAAEAAREAERASRAMFKPFT